HAGGYSKLTPDSNLDDGLFELIAIKAGSVYEITNALIDLFINKNLSNKNILYFKNKYFYIKPLNKPTNDTADIDGEKGPDYPLEIKVIPKKIKIIYND
ncbi:MAG: diacylglycerol kinase, partial [Halanaerobiales bacterium]